MGDRITFYMLSASGCRMRRGSVSRALLNFIVVSAVALMCGLGYGAYDYYHLYQSRLDTERLRQMLAERDARIADYAGQVSNFTEDINALKASLTELGAFERRIRLVAGLEPEAGEMDAFGVGGPMLERPETANFGLKSGLLREMHAQMDEIDTAAAVRAESFDGLMAAIRSNRNLLAGKPSIRPTEGIVSSTFGDRQCPFTGLPEFHGGLDIANHKGTPVIATADGVISFVGPKGPLGNMIVINHGHGVVTRYAHIETALKKPGDRVSRGDVIAQMGNTGRSTGPHLHYEVRVNGVAVNPKDYIMN